MTSHFLIDISIIAVGAVNLALVIHKSNIYKAVSIAGFISVLSAFLNGARFVALNLPLMAFLMEWLAASYWRLFCTL